MLYTALFIIEIIQFLIFDPAEYLLLFWSFVCKMNSHFHFWHQFLKNIYFSVWFIYLVGQNYSSDKIFITLTNLSSKQTKGASFLGQNLFSLHLSDIVLSDKYARFLFSSKKRSVRKRIGIWKRTGGRYQITSIIYSHLFTGTKACALTLLVLQYGYTTLKPIKTNQHIFFNQLIFLCF